MSGEPAGFALYFFHYSTFSTNCGLYLEDIFVREKFRGEGVGKALFKELGAAAQRHGCARLDLQVLDCNQNAISFYKRLGGCEVLRWETFRFDGEAIEKLGAEA